MHSIERLSVKIIFESPDAQAFALRILIERRVRQVFKRLDWLTSRVWVHLSGIPGSQGGIDKCCRIEISTNCGSPIVVTSLARDWFVALQSALTRAAKSLLHSTQYTPQPSIQLRTSRKDLAVST